MLTVWSRIWTQVVKNISSDENRNVRSASLDNSDVEMGILKSEYRPNVFIISSTNTGRSDFQR